MYFTAFVRIVRGVRESYFFLLLLVGLGGRGVELVIASLVLLIHSCFTTSRCGTVISMVRVRMTRKNKRNKALETGTVKLNGVDLSRIF